MKKFISLVIILGMVALFSVANASPSLVSDPNPELASGAVFKLMIDNVEQATIYPVADFAVKVDVQNYEGQKSIKAKFGNPWTDLPGEYKWSEWSSPFNYAFPAKPSAPLVMRISSE